MPGSTAFGYPYPLATEPVANGAAAIQALAQAVNDQLGWGRKHFYNPTVVTSPLSGAWGNAAGFTFPTVNNGVYAIECTLFINAGSSTPKAKFGWSWTGTGSMSSAQTGLDTTVVAPAYNGPWTAHALFQTAASPLQPATGIGMPAQTGGACTIARISATYMTGATGAGAVQLRLAQFTSDATWPTRVEPGSRMSWDRIA